MWPSPPINEHIKNTSMCGVIITENQLETGRKTYTTTAVKKDPHESGRKGREDQVRICNSRRGHGRGQEYHGLRDPSTRVSGLNHILSTLALKPSTGKMSPLSWFEPGGLTGGQ